MKNKTRLPVAISGAAYIQDNGEGLELLRFSPEVLSEATPTTHGFNPIKARTTAGVKLSFLTDSPVASLKFRYDKPFQIVIIANGETSLKRVNPNIPLQIDTGATKNDVLVEISMPLFHNPLLTDLTVPDGYSIIPPGLDTRPAFVAIGDSISHGRGQNHAPQGWAWQVADALDLQFYNLGVGGSNANSYMPESLSEIKNVAIVSILWGYNDWVNRGKTPSQFEADLEDAIDVIRRHSPDSQVLLLQVLPTKTKTSKRTGASYTVGDFNEIIRLIVSRRLNAGDSRIQVIHVKDRISVDEHLADNVHLNIDGATILACEVINKINYNSNENLEYKKCN